ncbi:MAG: hypothetical protein P8J45_07980 [Phycisphaerales bacterium]|nr:hypothetical protein [Phycisphaerales bacterium]
MLHLPHILLLTGLLQAPPGPPGPPMPPADEDRPSEDLRVEIVPTIWFPRMLGSYTIGPEGTSLDVETDTYLHDSELAFQGELDYRFDEWTIRILGSEFSTSGNGILSESARVDGVALAPGDDWESEYAQWSIGIEVDYAFWRPFADEPFSWSEENTRADNTDQDGDYLVDLRLSPRLGFRYLHVNQTFNSAAGGVSYAYDGGVAALVLGVIVEIQFDTRPLVSWLPQVSIEAGATVSPVLAGGSGYLSSIEATLRPYFSHNASLIFGFRLQGTSFTSEEYEREGSIMGLVAGFSLEF